MLEVNLRNFRCWSSLDLTFINGLNLLDGPSGVGKSTVCEAIYFALYGTINKVGPFDFKGTTQVRLAFTYKNQKVTIVRQRPAMLTVIVDGKEYVKDEAQAWINNKLATIDLWFSSSYLSQNSRHFLMSASAADRIKLLTELTFGEQTERNNPSYYLNILAEQLSSSNRSLHDVQSQTTAYCTFLTDFYKRHPNVGQTAPLTNEQLHELQTEYTNNKGRLETLKVELTKYQQYQTLMQIVNSIEVIEAIDETYVKDLEEKVQVYKLQQEVKDFNPLALEYSLDEVEEMESIYRLYRTYGYTEDTDLDTFLQENKKKVEDYRRYLEVVEQNKIKKKINQERLLNNQKEQERYDRLKKEYDKLKKDHEKYLSLEDDLKKLNVDLDKVNVKEYNANLARLITFIDSGFNLGKEQLEDFLERKHKMQETYLKQLNDYNNYLNKLEQYNISKDKYELYKHKLTYYLKIKEKLDRYHKLELVNRNDYQFNKEQYRSFFKNGLDLTKETVIEFIRRKEQERKVYNKQLKDYQEYPLLLNKYKHDKELQERAIKYFNLKEVSIPDENIIYEDRKIYSIFIQNGYDTKIPVQEFISEQQQKRKDYSRKLEQWQQYPRLYSEYLSKKKDREEYLLFLQKRERYLQLREIMSTIKPNKDEINTYESDKQKYQLLFKHGLTENDNVNTFIATEQTKRDQYSKDLQAFLEYPEKYRQYLKDKEGYANYLEYNEIKGKLNSILTRKEVEANLNIYNTFRKYGYTSNIDEFVRKEEEKRREYTKLLLLHQTYPTNLKNYQSTLKKKDLLAKISKITEDDDLSYDFLVKKDRQVSQELEQLLCPHCQQGVYFSDNTLMKGTLTKERKDYYLDLLNQIRSQMKYRNELLNLGNFTEVEDEPIKVEVKPEEPIYFDLTLPTQSEEQAKLNLRLLDLQDTNNLIDKLPLEPTKVEIKPKEPVYFDLSIPVLSYKRVKEIDYAKQIKEEATRLFPKGFIEMEEVKEPIEPEKVEEPTKIEFFDLTKPHNDYTTYLKLEDDLIIYRQKQQLLGNNSLEEFKSIVQINLEEPVKVDKPETINHFDLTLPTCTYQQLQDLEMAMQLEIELGDEHINNGIVEPEKVEEAIEPIKVDKPLEITIIDLTPLTIPLEELLKIQNAYKLQHKLNRLPNNPPKEPEKPHLEDLEVLLEEIKVEYCKLLPDKPKLTMKQVKQTLDSFPLVKVYLKIKDHKLIEDDSIVSKYETSKEHLKRYQQYLSTVNPLLKQIQDLQPINDKVNTQITELEARQQYLTELFNFNSINSEYYQHYSNYAKLKENETQYANRCSNIQQIIHTVKNLASQFLEERIVAINSTLNSVLTTLFEKPISVIITAHRTLKNGNDKIEATLDIHYNGTSYGNDFRMFSGGEQDRISLALLIAFHQVVKSPFIILDEVLSSISAAMKEECLHTLQRWCPDTSIIHICHEAVKGQHDHIVSL